MGLCTFYVNAGSGCTESFHLERLYGDYTWVGWGYALYVR